jgi:hypothetical protein
MLRALSGGEEPSDDSVILGITAALQEDDSFIGHVDRQGGDFLAERDNWAKIYRAASATIYHEYLVAVEKSEWP